MRAATRIKPSPYLIHTVGDIGRRKPDLNGWHGTLRLHLRTLFVRAGCTANAAREEQIFGGKI